MAPSGRVMTPSRAAGRSRGWALRGEGNAVSATVAAISAKTIINERRIVIPSPSLVLWSGGRVFTEISTVEGFTRFHPSPFSVQHLRRNPLPELV
jgi:hypothetical protein